MNQNQIDFMLIKDHLYIDKHSWNSEVWRVKFLFFSLGQYTQ